MTDDEFVRDVYDACRSRLVGQMYALCGDLAVAEDIVQEAFARALLHSHAFRRTDNPEAWLRRVALNLSHSRWRRLTTHRRLRHKLVTETSTPELSPDHVALTEALRVLPERQREALVLHHIADLPVHEIATATDASIGTVKSRLSRGRSALAALLSEDTQEHPHA